MRCTTGPLCRRSALLLCVSLLPSARHLPYPSVPLLVVGNVASVSGHIMCCRSVSTEGNVRCGGVQYVIWLVAWLSWNVFVTCFYLNVGTLDNRQDWLNFGTGSASWWEVRGVHHRHTSQTHITDMHHRHTSQTRITDTHHRHASQTHITDIHHRYTSQT